MCSIFSWMTSHSTGQRGGERENGACGSPGDHQGCVEGASLPWWGVCPTTSGAARAPGRAGGLLCRWGRGIPQNQGRGRERALPPHLLCWRAMRGCRVSLTVWLVPRTSLPARAGVTHDGCLGMLPGGFPQGHGSLFPACLFILGRTALQPGGRRGHGSGTGGETAEQPGLTSEVAIEAQVGADEAVIGLQELSPSKPPRSPLPSLGSAVPHGLHACESPRRPGTAVTLPGLGWPGMWLLSYRGEQGSPAAELGKQPEGFQSH